MSTLRQRLKRPETYLAGFALVAVLILGDSLRDPKNQMTAQLYVAAVHAYQHYARPLSSRFATCRYQPTSSQYSIEAVEKYGIRQGLLLTAKRVYSCRKSVPLGTSDPVR
jgi:putative membrane protein insertion efficiency factor